MGKNLSASQISQNWQAAMANPQTQQSYINGINSVQQSPMEAAANNAAGYQAGVQNAVASGKYQTNLRAVPLSTYKNNAVAKAPRLATGAAAAQSKYLGAMNKWAPIYQQASAAAAAIPKGGFAAAQAKWAASTQVLMNAAGTGTGGM